MHRYGEKGPFLAPSTRYFSDVFENGGFWFVSITLLSTRKLRFREPETQGFIFDPQRGDFWKPIGFSVFHSSFGGVIHHILLALSILLKGCYRKSVIHVDGRKRFRYIGFVWTRFPCWRQGKKIRFKKYSDPCGPSSLVFSVKLKKQLLFNCANFYVVFFGCKRDKNKWYV